MKNQENMTNIGEKKAIEMTDMLELADKDFRQLL